MSKSLNHSGSASSVEEPSDAISPGRAQCVQREQTSEEESKASGEASRSQSHLNFGSRGSPLPDHEWATQQHIFSKSFRTLLVTSYQSKLEIAFHCNKEMIRLSVSPKCTHASGKYSQFQFLSFIPVSPRTPWIQMISPREEARQDDDHARAQWLRPSETPHWKAALWFANWTSRVVEKRPLLFFLDGLTHLPSALCKEEFIHLTTSSVAIVPTWM